MNTSNVGTTCCHVLRREGVVLEQPVRKRGIAVGGEGMPQRVRPTTPSLDLEVLRRRLVGTARRQGVAPADAEDVAQEALAKVVGERVRPGAPPMEVRAFVALRDQRIEYIRKRSRETERRSPWPVEQGSEDSLGEPVGVARVEDGFALIEAVDVVCRVVGEDSMCFAYLKAFGATERDVQEIMGWTAQRAAAARVRLSRKKGALARALLETLEGGK